VDAPASNVPAEEATPDEETPGVETPDTEAPDAEAPDAEAPEAEATPAKSEPQSPPAGSGARQDREAGIVTRPVAAQTEAAPEDGAAPAQSAQTDAPPAAADNAPPSASESSTETAGSESPGGEVLGSQAPGSSAANADKTGESASSAVTDPAADERARIVKENQRKMDEYNDKISKAETKKNDLNFRFADWYYVISEDVYKKIHLSRSDVIQLSEESKQQGSGIGAARDLMEQGLEGGLEDVPVAPPGGNPE
jgi:hypothetical protein